MDFPFNETHAHTERVRIACVLAGKVHSEVFEGKPHLKQGSHLLVPQCWTDDRYLKRRSATTADCLGGLSQLNEIYFIILLYLIVAAPVWNHKIDPRETGLATRPVVTKCVSNSFLIEGFQKLPIYNRTIKAGQLHWRRLMSASVNSSNIFYWIQMSLRIEMFGLQSFSIKHSNYAVRKCLERLSNVRRRGSNRMEGLQLKHSSFQLRASFMQSVSALNAIFAEGLINPCIDLRLTTLLTHTHTHIRHANRLTD